MSGAPTRKEQYKRAVIRNLSAELSDDAMLCPRCSDGWVQPGTAAGRMGVCPSCWNKAIAEAHRLAAKELDAIRENDAARAKVYRARKRAGGK